MNEVDRRTEKTCEEAGALICLLVLLVLAVGQGQGMAIN